MTSTDLSLGGVAILDFDNLPDAVAIVGSRKFPKMYWVERFVGELRPTSVVISGTDPKRTWNKAWGVDETAIQAARDRGLTDTVWHPKPGKPFREALFARNTDIVLDAKRLMGIVVAFLLDPPTTGGTDDTLAKCNRYDVPSIVFPMSEDGTWLAPRVNRTWASHPKWSNLLLAS